MAHDDHHEPLALGTLGVCRLHLRPLRGLLLPPRASDIEPQNLHQSPSSPGKPAWGSRAPTLTAWRLVILFPPEEEASEDAPVCQG